METKYSQDVYVSPTTYAASIMCVSGVIETVRRAAQGEGRKYSVAVSRPPGHHGEQLLSQNKLKKSKQAFKSAAENAGTRRVRGSCESDIRRCEERHYAAKAS